MPGNADYIKELDEALERFRNGTGPLPKINPHRRPPTRRPQAEIDAARIRTREWYIEAAVELKARAEATVVELETKKTAATEEDLTTQDASAKAELGRAEKQYQMMLERAKPTTEELETAARKVVGEEI